MAQKAMRRATMKLSHQRPLIRTWDWICLSREMLGHVWMSDRSWCLVRRKAGVLGI